MTMRQMDIALKQIDRRTHNTFALRASLHGVKIPFKSSASRVEVQSTPEEDAAIEREIRATLARKQAELRSRHG